MNLAGLVKFQLWEKYVKKDFRNKEREDMESWREMYERCTMERAEKLEALKARFNSEFYVFLLLKNQCILFTPQMYYKCRLYVYLIFESRVLRMMPTLEGDLLTKVTSRLY